VEVEERLKKAGLKVTRQRLALLEELDRAGGFLTAEDLQDRLSPRTGMNRSTVYRILAVLEQRGLVERMERRDGCACYRLSGQEHCHLLVCTRCHKAVPVQGCPLEDLERRLSASTGFIITGHSLELTGLCPKCAAKK